MLPLMPYDGRALAALLAHIGRSIARAARKPRAIGRLG